MCSEEILESGCDCKGAFVFLQFVFNFVKMPFLGGTMCALASLSTT